MGFMDKIKAQATATSNSMKTSMKKTQTKAKVAAGSLMSVSEVPQMFQLNAWDEPVLVGGAATLISGPDKTLKGQIFVTPHYVLILTRADGNDVKVVLPHVNLQAIQRVFCPRGESSTGALTVGPPPPDAPGPNTIRLCYNDGSAHTFIRPTNGKFLTNWLHTRWDIMRSAPSPSAPLRAGGSDPHTIFQIPRSCVLLGIHKISLISGAAKIPASLVLFVGSIGLCIGGLPDTDIPNLRPLLIHPSTVQFTARARVMPNPDVSVSAPMATPLLASDTSVTPKGILMYTSDGLVHQLVDVKDIQLAYNRIVSLVSLAIDQPPVYW